MIVWLCMFLFTSCQFGKVQIIKVVIVFCVLADSVRISALRILIYLLDTIANASQVNQSVLLIYFVSHATACKPCSLGAVYNVPFHIIS